MALLGKCPECGESMLLPDIGSPLCEHCGYGRTWKTKHLDIGCGEAKIEGWVGLDIRKLNGVEVVWDANRIPWPLDEREFTSARAHHFIEHIPRVSWYCYGTRFPFVEFMDEVWRILVDDGYFSMWYPPAGSEAFYQDPTHVNPCNFATWLYFDPEAEGGYFYNCYKPRPWRYAHKSVDGLGMHFVILQKRGI